MCGKKCLKAINCFFQAVLLLISNGQMLYGAYCLTILYLTTRPETLGQQYITIPALLLTIFGIVLLPVIILGCCGSYRGASGCVFTHTVFLVVLSGLQIAVGVLAIIVLSREDNNLNLKELITEEFDYSMKNYINDPSYVDNIQYMMHCCGKDTPLDWIDGSLPNSCCANADFRCSTYSHLLYKNGCLKKMTGFIELHNLIVGYVLIAAGIVEVAAAVFSLALGCVIGKFDRTSYKV